MVVLSSLLEGAQFETRLEGEVYLVRLVGVWEAATPPSHPSLLTHRRRVHVHSLSDSLPGQPWSMVSSLSLHDGDRARFAARFEGQARHRVSPARVRRPSRHPFHRVGSNLSSRSRCCGSLKRRVAASPLGGNSPVAAVRSS